MDKVDCVDILEKAHCNDCGWSIINVCCNGSFNKFEDADKWDWWLYCSNKSCKNHHGEGVFQSWPDWVIVEK
jgi:hypothetical protein